MPRRPPPPRSLPPTLPLPHAAPRRPVSRPRVLPLAPLLPLALLLCLSRVRATPVDVHNAVVLPGIDAEAVPAAPAAPAAGAKPSTAGADAPPVVHDAAAEIAAAQARATAHDASVSNGSTARADLPHAPAMHSSLLSLLPESLRATVQSADGFVPAFLQSFFLIVACELGDRTFFVAAILAMKASRVVVWSGALGALALMTVLSAGIGKAFPLLLDKRYTSIVAALLFLYFGLQLLRDWWRMRDGPPAENEELAEVEEELKHERGLGGADGPDDDDDAGKKRKRVTLAGSRRLGLLAASLFSPVLIKSFSMTLLAEWGDRSQIATIALAASRDLYGVIAGGVIGHGLCTGLAVVGGRLLATKISERAVALMGGILFVSFAFLTFGGVLE